MSMMACTFTSLKRISVPGGDVLKMLTAEEQGALEFGEIYATHIDSGLVKSWRRNLNATANLIVVAGQVRFVTTFDGDKFDEFVMSPEHDYGRLRIEPNYWMAFQGLSLCTSLIVNILDNVHTAVEIERKELNEFKYRW